MTATKRIILFPQDKGGIGRSFVATLLHDFLTGEGVRVKAFDLDHANSTFNRLVPEAEFIDTDVATTKLGVLGRIVPVLPEADMVLVDNWTPSRATSSPTDLPLHLGSQTAEHQLLLDPRGQFGSEMLLHPTQHRSFDAGPPQLLHPHGFDRAQVGREDDVVFGHRQRLARRHRHPRPIEHLEKNIQHQRMRLLHLVKKERAPPAALQHPAQHPAVTRAGAEQAVHGRLKLIL